METSMFEAYTISIALLSTAWAVGHLLNSVLERIERGDKPPPKRKIEKMEPVTTYGGVQ